MIDSFGRFTPDYPGQQYYQDPMYVRYMNQHQQPQAPQQPPSTRTVEVEPADNVKAATEFPVAAGATKMIVGRDDSFIVVKAVSVTGQVTIDIFDRRPPEPPAPVINPDDFVRRDEIGELIAMAISERQPKKTAAKKEDAE
jgi:hypothetical protein